MQLGLKTYGSSYSFGVDDDATPVGIKVQGLTSSSTSTFYKSTEALQKFKYYDEEQSSEGSSSRVRAWTTVAGAYVWLLLLPHR